MSKRKSKFELILALAERDGYAAGEAAALYAMTHDLQDAEPPNLSGEWADDPTPSSLASEYGVDDPDDIAVLCDAWENGASDAWADHYAPDTTASK